MLESLSSSVGSCGFVGETFAMGAIRAISAPAAVLACSPVVKARLGVRNQDELIWAE